MPTPATREQIGEYLYFFRSPVTPCNNVLIVGHAGWVPSLGNTFVVPAGVRLHFRVWDGNPNTSNPTREIVNPYPTIDSTLKEIAKASNKAALMLLDAHEKRNYRPGDMCYNYVIVKGVGRHWNARNPGETSYTVIARELGIAAHAGKPSHFVSVRNRRFRGASHYVLLGDVITAVQAHLTGQNDLQFVMAGCRGMHPEWRPN
jgi:hypothetical protein